MQFRSTAETFTGEQIRLLRVDNVPELIRGRLQAHCISHGIVYEKTVPDSPNQNGIAERSNQTLTCMTCAMLLDADLSSWFWPFAIQTAIHIKNCVPHSNLPTHTDTGLCLLGFSGLKGSVSRGEPAPISGGGLGAEGADGCDVSLIAD